MTFKHFGLLIIVRLVVLSLGITGFVYMFNNPRYHVATFLMFLIVNIYLITALVHSVGGLKKRKYNRFSEEDFLNLPKAADPKRQLAALYIEYRVKNFRAINLKVDSMHLATQFFKRALIAAFVVAVAIFVFNIYSSSIKKPAPAPKTSKAQTVI